ncbi:P-loop ATPase, Sll1717 family [Phycicoccus sp. Root563]|uniref:P-loop ATPase, Sll1717 family n=1 Tax=Phycicoccus sp. Root563 TaxID=1736562 RepID=UPI0012F7E6CA|nr:hypothetical protein [Phycicoccus sp. Root563]
MALRRESHTYSELLLSIDLGDEVAEVDPALAESFVRTADFDEFLSGRCDLITGIKGSGKSALLLMGAKAPPPRVDICHAQPSRGPVIYETDVPGQLTGDALEDYYLERWVLHTALTAAYFLLRLGECSAVHAELVRAGLPTDSQESEVAIWVSSGRIMRDVNINNIQFAQSLIREIDEQLVRNDRSIWVAYDRLDDVTFAKPQLEQTVLRGLLRAHIYLARVSARLKSKMFLRSDILDRATLGAGLRNLDKVPVLRLNMNAHDMSLLIARRFMRSERFNEILGEESHQHDLGEETLPAVMAHILPKERLNSNNKRRPNFLDVYGAYFYDTTDGSGKFAARNVLAYLRLAIVQQRRICEDGRIAHLPHSGPVLSNKALHAAWVQLSENRLHSYVYAEFPSTRNFVERLEYGPYRYGSIRDLGKRFFGDTDSMRETRTVVDMLKYCGVLGESGQSFSVGRVYRPALRCRDTPRPSGKQTSGPRSTPAGTRGPND